jgi:type VI secretion system secreted protein Hcp
MDLLILVPGDQSIFPKPGNNFDAGGSLLGPGTGEDSTVPNWWKSYDFLGNQTGVELVSMHQGMRQQVTTDVSNSARTSGRPVVTEFTCVKYVDPTSVKFYDYCLRAQPLDNQKTAPTSLYICRNSGDQVAAILQFQLKYALVSEIQMQTHPNDAPTEQFKLNFAEVIWKFQVQTADVSAGGFITAGWSLARNAPIGSFTLPGK